VTEYAFVGRERVTIELDGTFRPETIVIPRRLQLDLVDGRARVRLFAFHVEGMRISGVPLVRSSYGEVLWRIAVRDRGMPAWWVIACDLHALPARWAAARWVRYPVRSHRVAVELDELRIDAGSRRLGIDVGVAGNERVAIEDRPLLVGPDAGWTVPWGDDREPARPALTTVDADSLSEITVGAAVTWAPVALVRRYREHLCGRAIARVAP
jgi:hypothetical protein